MKKRLRATLRDIKLPRREAAAILESVNVPGPKRRTSPLGDKPFAARRRKGNDDNAPAAQKPVLVLGK